MKYSEMTSKLQKRMNDFDGIIFAFTKVQLKEAMEKKGLDIETDMKKLVSIGGGGLVLKDRLQEFKQIIADNESDRKAFLSNEENLKDALIYELGNHEFCITYELEPTLDALGLSASDIPEHILSEAKTEYLSECY